MARTPSPAGMIWGSVGGALAYLLNHQVDHPLVGSRYCLFCKMSTQF
jgi:hypothetical protein